MSSVEDEPTAPPSGRETSRFLSTYDLMERNCYYGMRLCWKAHGFRRAILHSAHFIFVLQKQE